MSACAGSLEPDEPAPPWSWSEMCAATGHGSPSNLCVKALSRKNRYVHVKSAPVASVQGLRSWEGPDILTEASPPFSSHLAPTSKSPFIPDGGEQAWEVRRQLNMGLKTGSLRMLSGSGGPLCPPAAGTLPVT